MYRSLYDRLGGTGAETEKSGTVSVKTAAGRQKGESNMSFVYKRVLIKISGEALAGEKALEAGASAIVVSNHGGRVLDQCPATAEVLPAIVDAVGDKMTILVDGGIRTGMDVFKALALGADAVLIARPFVNMVYGGGAEGVKIYVEKLKAELADTMAMCGAHCLADINRSMIYGY